MLAWRWGKALLSNYSNSPQKGYIEITPDAGLPYRRQTFSDISDLVNATFCLTRDKYTEFMSWYKFDLRQGTLPFSMFDCRYGILRTARLVGDPPQYQPNSNRQNLSVTIAFEPSILYKKYLLTVDDGLNLIVNTDDALTVNYGLRL